MLDENGICEMSRVRRPRSNLFKLMRTGVRKKSISKIIASAAISILAAGATPSFAVVIHRHPVVKHVVEEPTIPLSSIHVLGDRPAPFALDARAACMIDADTGAVLYSYNEHA